VDEPVNDGCGGGFDAPSSVPPASIDEVVASVADHVAEVVFVLDQTGIIRWANAGLDRVLDQDPAAWVGRHGAELAHPDDVPLGLELMVSAMATGPGVKEPVRYRLARSDGSWLDFECIATTVALATDETAFVLTCRPTGVARPPSAIFDEASERVSRMFEEAAIGMAQVGLDGRILRVNARLAEIVRSSVAELLGARFLDVVHPDDRVHVLVPTAEELVASAPRSAHVRLLPRDRSDDDQVHARVTTSLVFDRLGQPLYHAVQVSDVTDLVQAQQAQAESEQRFRTILELAQEGIVAVDGDLVIRFANRRLAEMLGCTPDDLLGRDVDYLLEQHTVGVELSLDDWTSGAAQRFEARMRSLDGAVRWVLVAASTNSWPIDGSLGTVVMITDIDDLKAAEAELRHRSTHDSLTGLANRALLEAAWDVAGESTSDAVIVLDLDGFKAVNDTYGHAEGDAVLVEVARRLSAAVRRGDLVARFGGDEFVVVCRGADHDTAVHLAARLVDDLNQSFVVGEHHFDLGASAGLAMGRPGVTHLELLREADGALYEAKRRGGHQVRAAGAAD